MQELSPDEFKEILDENGEIAPQNLSRAEKEKLLFLEGILNARCDSGMRCQFCKGTRFYPPNSNFKCTYCNGMGWR